MPMRALLRQVKPLATASTCLTGKVTRTIVPMITITIPTRMIVTRLQSGYRYLELCDEDDGQCQIAIVPEPSVSRDSAARTRTQMPDRRGSAGAASDRVERLAVVRPVAGQERVRQSHRCFGAVVVDAAAPATARLP